MKKTKKKVLPLKRLKAVKVGFKTGLGILSVIGVSIYFNEFKWSYQSPVVFQSPVVVERRQQVLGASSITPTPTPKAVPVEIVIGKGEASFYSMDGCIGCRVDRKMANGETLDDTKLTVALVPDDFKEYKNKTVIVENLANNKKIEAKVTDSGGFKKYKRVADLSLATKNAIDCEDLCQVKIVREVE